MLTIDIRWADGYWLGKDAYVFSRPDPSTKARILCFVGFTDMRPIVLFYESVSSWIKETER